jgi:hypothetical protein
MDLEFPVLGKLKEWFAVQEVPNNAAKIGVYIKNPNINLRLMNFKGIGSRRG